MSNNNKRPQGGPPQQPLTTGCTVRTMTMWLLMALIAFTVFQIFGSGADSLEIHYSGESGLMDYISQDRIKSVVIQTGGSVEGEFTSPVIRDGVEYTKFNSFIPFENTGVLDSLAAHNVKVTAEPPNELLAQILSFIPFLLLIGFFIYFETAAVDAFGKEAVRWLRWLYFIPPVVFAGVADVDRIWVFANIAVGVCAIPNLIAVLALSGTFLELMRDYLSGEKKYAAPAIDESRDYARKAG